MGGVKIIDKNDVTDALNSQVMWDYVDEEVFKNAEISKVSGYVSKNELNEKLKEFKTYCDNMNYPYV